MDDQTQQPLDPPRRHPDLFNATEAAEYLRLDNKRALEDLRVQWGLAPLPIGHDIYHREDLDRTIELAHAAGRRPGESQVAREPDGSAAPAEAAAPARTGKPGKQRREVSSRFYTMKEMATMLGIDRSTLYGWIRKGQMPPAIRRGNRRVWFRPVVERWFEDGCPPQQAGTERHRDRG